MDREGLRKVAEALGYEPATVKRSEIKGIHTYTPENGFRVKEKQAVHLLDRLAPRRGFNRVNGILPDWRINKKPTTLGRYTKLETRPLVQNGIQLRVEKHNPNSTASKPDNIVTTITADILRLETYPDRLRRTRTYGILIEDED